MEFLLLSLLYSNAKSSGENKSIQEVNSGASRPQQNPPLVVNGSHAARFTKGNCVKRFAQAYTFSEVPVKRVHQYATEYDGYYRIGRCV